MAMSENTSEDRLPTEEDDDVAAAGGTDKNSGSDGDPQIDVSDAGGETDGSNHEQSEEEKQEIEAEQQERLDPENRPSNAEVDNTGREFDPEIGQFTDHEPDPSIGPYDTAERDAGDESEATSGSETTAGGEDDSA